METNQNSSNSADEHKARMDLQKIKDNQNLTMGIAGGSIGAIVGAGLWAAITVITEYQIGWMAIGVGFLVGYSVRFLGKGVDPIFGIVGAVFSLIGCALGNILTIIIFSSMQQNISVLEILPNINFPLVLAVATESFQVMDLLFYGIALYEGYRFSIVDMEDDEVEE